MTCFGEKVQIQRKKNTNYINLNGLGTCIATLNINYYLVINCLEKNRLLNV